MQCEKDLITITGIEARGRGPCAKECRWLADPEKGKDTDPIQSIMKGTSPADTLILVQRDPS